MTIETRTERNWGHDVWDSRRYCRSRAVAGHHDVHNSGIKGATLIPNQTYLRYKTKGNNTSRHTDYDNLVHDRKDNDIDETNASLVRTIWILCMPWTVTFLSSSGKAHLQPGEFVMFGLRWSTKQMLPRRHGTAWISHQVASAIEWSDDATKSRRIECGGRGLVWKSHSRVRGRLHMPLGHEEWSSSSSISPLWGGLYTDPTKQNLRDVRSLLGSTNECLFTQKQITFIDRDGFIRNGQEDSTNSTLRMLTDLEKRVILSTSCSLSYKPAYASGSSPCGGCFSAKRWKDTSNVPVVLKGGFTSTTTTSSGTAVDITPASADAIVNAFNLQVGDCGDFGVAPDDFWLLRQNKRPRLTTSLDSKWITWSKYAFKICEKPRSIPW